MKYCRRCILPDTRPNLIIASDGICNACHSSLEKSSIDWTAREMDFVEVVNHSKSKKREYDCLIPVSGGKDSTWQTVQCLKYGLRPLAVTWKTPARTEIGSKNLENLIRLGVDHIDFQINPKVERKFMLLAFERFGSTAIPMHMALFNIPLKIAVKFNIPLIVWGENSAFEYGGSEEETRGFRLDEKWLRKFGVTHGTTAADWVSEDLTREELTPYDSPEPGELEKKGILAVFLGYYFPWDPSMSLKVAEAHGFRVSGQGPKTGIYDYADIDDDFISIHHYLKWYKFGFTRTFDNLSLEIRQNRLKRSEALELLKQRGDEKPFEDIEKFCEFAGISTGKFEQTCEKFRNRSVWTQKNNQWLIPDFIIKDWSWS